MKLSFSTKRMLLEDYDDVRGMLKDNEEIDTYIQDLQYDIGLCKYDINVYPLIKKHVIDLRQAILELKEVMKFNDSQN